VYFEKKKYTFLFVYPNNYQYLGQAANAWTVSVRVAL